MTCWTSAVRFLRWWSALSAIGLTLGAAVSAAAHEPPSPHRMPVVPEAVLSRPIGLTTGIGKAHDQTSTANADAQIYYDQGLSYLHNYIWIDAARCFHDALRRDPDLMLAYVGLSVAYDQLNQRTAAGSALAHALGMDASGEHDDRHRQIRVRQMAAEASPSDAAVRLSYQREIDAALIRFPADAELWLQRGMAEALDAGDRGQSSPASALPFYVRALAVAPETFAPHHYLAHAHENGGEIREALEQGGIYARQAPAVPHARHMFGHSLRRSGRIDEAIAEFEAADRLETAYFANQQLEPANDWHYEHNLDLLGMSYQYAGQLQKAAPVLERAFGLPTANLVQAVNKQAWPAFLRSTGQPDAALVAARTLAAFPNPVVEAIGRIEAAHVQLGNGRISEAAAEANAAARALKSATAGAGLASVSLQVLQGEFFLRTGRRDKGRATLLAAIDQAQRAQGPDEWARALFTLEATARAARDANDWEFARLVATRMIDHDGFYGGSHYALALAAEHDGDPILAGSELSLAGKYWERADPDFPAVVGIHERLSRFR